MNVAAPIITEHDSTTLVHRKHMQVRRLRRAPDCPRRASASPDDGHAAIPPRRTPLCLLDKKFQCIYYVLVCVAVDCHARNASTALSQAGLACMLRRAAVCASTLAAGGEAIVCPAGEAGGDDACWNHGTQIPQGLEVSL